MRTAEKNLLLAVRDRLRTTCQYQPEVCQIEFDEMAPATTGNLYVAVMPGGWRPGRAHNTSGGVHDLVYGVDVAVMRRIAHVPRDRLRDVFIGHLGGLDEELDKVHLAVDFSYDVNNAANALINLETGSTQGFIEPLKFVSVDRRPRLAPESVFAATRGEQPIGMMRVISFFGARRITYR